MSQQSRFRRRPIVLALAGGAAAAILATSTAGASSSTVVGGITLYQARVTNAHIQLGPQSSPTLVLSKAVPVGTYLVTAEVGVTKQTGSYIVCAVANVVNGNDGVFGTNGMNEGGQVNVAETEVIKVTAGQSLHLMCDDNIGLKGNVVGTALMEATPVNALH
jgi:hypothetical protein